MADCNDGDLRLVDRSDENSTISGRLEICINNAWGTVCDNGFGRTEAAVACAQLGGYSRESKYMLYCLSHRDLSMLYLHAL